MKKIIILLFLGAFLTVVGCKKFLEEEPTKQTVIKTVDQLEALVNNATLFTYDGGQGNGGQDASAGYSTDDTEIPLQAYKNFQNKWTLNSLVYFTFKIDEIIGAGSDLYWNGEYKKIFTANLVLANLDKVTGDAAIKSELKADAHFIRAYAYWVLVNHYCLPYTNNNKDVEGLGLPLKQTVNYEEPLARATLKQTYDFIEADIAEAKKTTRDDVDLTKPWRVSKKGIEAFLSRYYLFLGNYDESLTHTNNALTSTSAVLVDFHNIATGTPANYSNPAQTLVYSELNGWTAPKHLYWKEFYFPRFASQASQWLQPSPSLLSLYDQSNDLRFKWFMIPNSNRRFGFVVTPGLYRYTVFQDGTFIPTGPTVAEMWLNKAEILARKGDVNGAIQAVNTLRAKRMNTPAPLTATDQADAIVKVLEERRRELPFGFRWHDIRRFSVNNYAADDVTVTHTFFKVNGSVVDTTSIQTYTLPVGSKRYAVPINGVEIMASKNVITQNQY